MKENGAFLSIVWIEQELSTYIFENQLLILRALERRMTLKMWIKHDRLRRHINTKRIFLFQSQINTKQQHETSLINGRVHGAGTFREFVSFCFRLEFVWSDIVTWFHRKKWILLSFFHCHCKRCNWELFEFYSNSAECKIAWRLQCASVLFSPCVCLYLYVFGSDCRVFLTIYLDVFALSALN